MSSLICASKHKRRCIFLAGGLNSSRSDRGGRMPTLGDELARLRRLKGWTLRDVEEKTKKKVSNSYLYQLESGIVKEPSPNILYELARVYDVSYGKLMRLAGFMVPSSKAKGTSNQN